MKNLSNDSKQKVIQYINEFGGAAVFHFLNEIFISTLDKNFIKTNEITCICSNLTSKEIQESQINWDLVLQECIISNNQTQKSYKNDFPEENEYKQADYIINLN